MAAAARLGTMATFANSPGNAMLPAKFLRPVPLLLLALVAILLVVSTLAISRYKVTLD